MHLVGSGQQSLSEIGSKEQGEEYDVADDITNDEYDHSFFQIKFQSLIQTIKKKRFKKK